MRRNCVVLLLFCELTRSAIIKLMADHVSRRGKRKPVQFQGRFVWIIAFYFYYIFPPIFAFFKTNGYKRFSKTNSTDQRQRFLQCPPLYEINQVTYYYLLQFNQYIVLKAQSVYFCRKRGHHVPNSTQGTQTNVNEFFTKINRPFLDVK